MRREWKCCAILGLALAMSVSVSLVSLGKEEREKAGVIELSFSYNIRAGESGGDVDVSLGSGGCSVDSVDIINENDFWLGGDKPKVEVWLSADPGYYFAKSGKSTFSFSGDKVRYGSSSTRNDRSEMVLTVTLEKLDKKDEDLDVTGLSWDEANGIAHWDHQELAQSYKVRLCRYGNSSGAAEEGIGTVHTVKENSFDFSGRFPKAGSYYFKIRAVDSRGHMGEWQESSYMDVLEEDLVRLNGQWMKDDKGWWYLNPDGSSPKNGWQYIRRKWYFFDKAGYMKTGWIRWEDKLYYCGDSGAMLASTVTPDGHSVGADGARLD